MLTHSGGMEIKMKKVFALFLAVALLCSCGQKVQYVEGMFTDVHDYDAYRNAVEVCIEKGYFEAQGDSFGIFEPVSLSECASLCVKLGGFKSKNDIEFALKNGLVYEEPGDWDKSATRAEVAYMISHALDMEEINTVLDGALADSEDSFAKEEIYHLYRAGIFAGDKEQNTFRPDDLVNRMEMAVVIERSLDKKKRASFNMERLEARVIAFGDTIGHMPVVDSGRTSSGYDFTNLFKNVKPYIDSADIACLNQETIFVKDLFSGYPTFGTPKEYGEAELSAGFDVVTHATNHAYDKRESGILYTTEFWQGKDVVMLGIHESREDAEKIDTITKNGITLALLNYTYSLNGFSLPKDKEYLVDLLDDEDKIREDVRRARQASDGVIVFLHFGNEYQLTPSDYQRKWAQLFADEGVLAIVGAHPHVVEPMEIVEGKNGNLVPVYYSLGNFISNQNDLNCALCAMADFKVVKDRNGVHIEAAKIVPVITHMEKNNYTAYLLDDYTDELARRHKFSQTHRGKFSIEYMRKLFDDITGS